MSGARLYRLAAALAHGAQPTLAAGWRHLVRLTARDETDASARRSCLVIAPHPDDETIGCGATIARKRHAGSTVTVVIVADGRYAQSGSTLISPTELAELRAVEAEAACKALGVDPGHVIQLGYEDTVVARREEQLIDEITTLLERHRPEEVLVVSGLDHHPDHRAVSRATEHALRRSDLRPVVREYAVWSWIDGPWLDQRSRSPLGRAAHLLGQPLSALARGRATAVRTGRYAEAKQAALMAHATQTSAFTAEAGWAVMDEALLGVFPTDVELFLPMRRRERGRTCSTTS